MSKQLLVASKTNLEYKLLKKEHPRTSWNKRIYDANKPASHSVVATPKLPQRTPATTMAGHVIAITVLTTSYYFYYSYYYGTIAAITTVHTTILGKGFYCPGGAGRAAGRGLRDVGRGHAARRRMWARVKRALRTLEALNPKIPDFQEP